MSQVEHCETKCLEQYFIEQNATVQEIMKKHCSDLTQTDSRKPKMNFAKKIIFRRHLINLVPPLDHLPFHSI